MLFFHSLEHRLKLWRIVPKCEGRQNIQKQIHDPHGKCDRQKRRVKHRQDRKKTDRIGETVREHSLGTFDDEFFNIGGVVGFFEYLFAESAKPAKLPNLVFPTTNAELFVKLF